MASWQQNILPLFSAALSLLSSSSSCPGEPVVLWPWCSWTCPSKLWEAKMPQSSLQTLRKGTPFLNKCGTFYFSFTSFLPFSAALRRRFAAMSLMGVSTSLVGVCHQSTNKNSLLNITDLHTATTQGRPKSQFHISLRYIKQEFQLQVFSPRWEKLNVSWMFCR